MAITYHAGRRIQGTSTDFGTAGAGIPAVSGGWKEVGRTTLGSAGTTIDVSSIPDKRYYMVLVDHIASGSSQPDCRFNSDSGSNYSYRWSNDGSNGTSINQTNIKSSNGWNTSEFNVNYISNLASKEKLTCFFACSNRGAGAGTAPSRTEVANKWANTSDVISSMNYVNGAGGSFDTGTECVVLGFDPDDTHTTNFWEELASVELGSAGANIGSGTITAKKYLWIQTLIKPAAACNVKITFNSDTGSNYVDRYSYNGGADSTRTSQSNMSLDLSGNNALKFYNLFIVNNSANEKLIIGHSVDPTATGAGTAPDRAEHVAKWVNTSAQITDIDFDSTSGNYAAGSIIKVWGSD
tara:strand:+ start:206 stop:1261 length:1056 start_codon:yes stop_codon:yes gene_type:complete